VVGAARALGAHFEGRRDVRSGRDGKIAFVRTWIYSNQSPKGIGNPGEQTPPAGLDWDLWLGPAPARPFNPNRFGVYPKAYSYFRFFWDYAGGMMTDWGIHLLDIVQMAFNEAEPTTITSLGGKFYLQDSETPDTMQATFNTPALLALGASLQQHGSRDQPPHGQFPWSRYVVCRSVLSASRRRRV
jgi:hypothetical protein